MKSLNYWILMLLMATSCFTLVSCGDDDDEQGNGTTKKCHVDADGRNIDFGYAYFSIDEPSHSGGLYDYTLEFTNYDYLSILKNPASIVGKKISSFYIGFTSPNKYPYSRYSSNKKESYYECEIAINGTINSDGDESCEQYYETDWNSGYESGNLIINKTSEGLYKIEIRNRSLSDQAKLERGEKANGGKAKYLTLWSADVKDTVVNWNSTTVYTIPKNTDMVIYCDPTYQGEKIISVNSVSTGSTSADYYQLSYKIMQ